MPSTSASEGFGAPIIILGVAPRSGTNFLYDLVTLHPDANGCPAVYEDYLLMHAARLDKYVRSVVGQWRNMQGVWRRQFDDAAVQGLLAAIGDGLLGYLQERSRPPRLVTKTPSPANLDMVFQLFPAARVLLLVRDGRSVVESAVRSRIGPKHGHRYDVFTRQWAEAAREIVAFDALYRDSGLPYRIVRYESLVTRFAEEIPAVLATCDLAPERFDLATAQALPVRGSSTFGQQLSEEDEATALDWAPQAKSEMFAPLRRWKDWPATRHDMFNAIAGDAMTALGYELEGV